MGEVRVPSFQLKKKQTNTKQNKTKHKKQTAGFLCCTKSTDIPDMLLYKDILESNCHLRERKEHHLPVKHTRSLQFRRGEKELKMIHYFTEDNPIQPLLTDVIMIDIV